MTFGTVIRSGGAAAACASLAAISVLPAASASASVTAAGSMRPATGAQSSARPARPVIYGLPDGATRAPWSNFIHPQIRPTSPRAAQNTVTLVADGEWIVLRSWSSWRSASAYGSGTLYVRKLGGGPVRSSPARIHLYRVRRHDGRPYFTRLHFALRHRVYAQRSSTARFSPKFPPAWIKQS